jgi:hypothetical protein
MVLHGCREIKRGIAADDIDIAAQIKTNSK